MTNQVSDRGAMNAKRTHMQINQTRISVKNLECVHSEKEHCRNMQATKGQDKNVINHDFYHQEYGHRPNQCLQPRPLIYGTTDRSNYINIYPEVENIKNGTLKKKRKGPRGGVATPFPIKLYQLLESNEHSAIISWQPHGRCFIMRKPKEFLEQVMPRYFRQSKITSFQRQLNLYGFHRLTSGPDKGGYYHERFLRGKPEYCKNMLRVRIKGKGSKSASNPESEPNFYKVCSMDNVSYPIEDHSPLATEDKKFMDSMICYTQCSASTNNFHKNMEDTQITRQDSARKIENHISSPVCVSSTPLFESQPQLNQPVPSSNSKNYSSMHSVAKMQSYQLCSPPELTLSAVADDSDSMTFEGKEFHYIKSNSFNSNDENDPPFSDYIFPTLFPRPVASDECLNVNVSCYDPLGFKWSSGESELI